MYMSFLTWGVVGFVGGAVVLVFTIGPAGAAAGIAVNLALVPPTHEQELSDRQTFPPLLCGNNSLTVASRC